MNPDPPPVLHYAHPEVGGLHVIARFANATMGHLAAGKLEAAGIRCGLSESRSAYFGNDSATLSVAEEDVARAVDILGATPAKGHLVASVALPRSMSIIAAPPTSPPARVCPRCRSPRIVREPQYVKLAVGVLALAWLPWVGGWGWFVALEIFWILLWAISRKASCAACGWRDWASDLEESKG